VSYAAYRFVPLSSKEHSHSLGLTAPVDTNLRLSVFCDTYGLTARQSRALPEIVEISLRRRYACSSRDPPRQEIPASRG
jgi:hypothetical protein